MLNVMLQTEVTVIKRSWWGQICTFKIPAYYVLLVVLIKKISLWRRCRRSWVLLGSIPALGEKKRFSFNVSIHVIALPYSSSEQIFLQSPWSLVCLLRDFSVAVDIKL